MPSHGVVGVLYYRENEMAEKSTFIKLDRNIINWRWYKNANTFRVFIHLLLSANVTSHGFEKITVNRGELVSSYDRIAEAVGLSNQQVRTAIEHLKETEELTVRKYPKYQVFTIVNYDYYQSNQQANNRQLTVNQQSSNSQLTGNQQQYKNDKNIKNDKNVNNERVGATPPHNKKTYGQFSNVFLTDDECEALITLYPQDHEKKIDRLSEYMHQKGKNYADHYSVIIKWAKEDEEKAKAEKKDNNSSYEIDDFFATSLYNSNPELYNDLYPNLTKEKIIEEIIKDNS